MLGSNGISVGNPVSGDCASDVAEKGLCVDDSCKCSTNGVGADGRENCTRPSRALGGGVIDTIWNLEIRFCTPHFTSLHCSAQRMRTLEVQQNATSTRRHSKIARRMMSVVESSITRRIVNNVNLMLVPSRKPSLPYLNVRLYTHQNSIICKHVNDQAEMFE